MKMPVSERLKAIRNDIGLDQRSMAGRFGLGQSTWARLEMEDRAPKGDVLAKLVDMGYSADWLLTGQGEMKRGAPTAVKNPEKSSADSTAKEDGPQWNSPSAALAQQLAGWLYRILRENGLYPECGPERFNKVLDLMYGIEMEERDKAVAAGQSPPEPSIDRYRTIIKAAMR
jgi:transcriptional regulator with XRE-family HTH domain